jgi:uncharacterized protein (TIGR02268 family)
MLPTLLTLAVLAQTPTVTCSLEAPHPVARRIIQDSASNHPAERIYVAPDTATTVLFKSKVVADSIQVEDARGFALLVRDSAAVVVQPGRGQLGRCPLRLVARYAEEGLPREVELLLVVDGTLAERQVEVYRDVLTLEALQVLLKQKDEQLAEYKRRRAEAGLCPEAVQGLIQADKQGWLSAKSGAVPRSVDRVAPFSGAPVAISDVYTLRTRERVLVRFLMSRAPGAEWTEPQQIESALLMNANEKMLPVLAAEQDGDLLANQDATLRIEVYVKGRDVSGTWRVLLKRKNVPGYFPVGEVSFADWPADSSAPSPR